MTRDKQIALYLAMGFDLLPLRGGPDEDTSKRPLPGITFASRVKFNFKSMTPRELAELFMSHPEVNIGILTGSRSNISVIDIDAHQDIEQAKTVLTGLNLPSDTTTVKTGRPGLHFYYKTSGQVKSYDIKDSNGVKQGEVKGNGKYIVAPPSIHWEKGDIYTFLEGKGLDNIKVAIFPGPTRNAPRYTRTTPGGQGRVITPGGQAITTRIPGLSPLSTRISTKAIAWYNRECVKQLLDYDFKVGERQKGLFLLYSIMRAGHDFKDYAIKNIVKKNRELTTPLPEQDLINDLKKCKLYPHRCATIRQDAPIKLDCDNCKFIKEQETQMPNATGLFDYKTTANHWKAWYLIRTEQVDPHEIGKSIRWVDFAALIKAHDYRTAQRVIRDLTDWGYISRQRKLL